MSDCKISVIIPIYKVEQYLVQCVDNVLGQSYRNIEVVLVDDGSPDSCGAICDHYAKKDYRVKVIHKSNGGLSDARNAGLEIATGEYVVFLDSDDYWSSHEALDSLMRVVDTYKTVDIIYFRRFAFSEENKEIYQYPEFDLSEVNGKSKEEALDYLISNDRFIPSACNKMVRREVLDGIVFKKGIVCEDIDWNFALILKAQHLYVTNSLFYAYRKRLGSITQTMDSRNVSDLLSIVKSWSDILSALPSENESRNLLLSYCAYQYTIVLALIFYIKDTSRRKEFVREVCAIKYLLKYNKSKKVRMVTKVYSLLPLTLTGRILAFYIKMKKQ